MNYNIKGTGLDISDELRTYTEKKLATAEKFVVGDTTAHAGIELEHSPMRDGGKYHAEFTVSVGGTVYRAEEWGRTLHEAIDLATDGLAREMRQSKKKNISLIRRGAARFKDMVRGFRNR